MHQIPLARPNRVRLSTDDGTDEGSVGALIGEEISALGKNFVTRLYFGLQFSMKGGKDGEWKPRRVCLILVMGKMHSSSEQILLVLC